MSRLSSRYRLALKGLLLALATFTLGGCASVGVQDYAGQKPRFDLRQFFNGPLEATGVFQDRSGKVVRRFHARLLGVWHGDHGELREHFRYVGNTPDQERTWHLTVEGPGRFSGTGQGSAGDIVGTATGRGAGFALHWRYDVSLPVGKKHYKVHFDDWMWRVNADTVIDRSTVTKFGFRVGELSMVIRKLPQGTSCAPRWGIACPQPGSGG